MVLKFVHQKFVLVKANRIIKSPEAHSPCHSVQTTRSKQGSAQVWKLKKLVGRDMLARPNRVRPRGRFCQSANRRADAARRTGMRASISRRRRHRESRSCRRRGGVGGTPFLFPFVVVFDRIPKKVTCLSFAY
jgi:hypothetical protein